MKRGEWWNIEKCENSEKSGKYREIFIFDVIRNWWHSKSSHVIKLRSQIKAIPNTNISVQNNRTINLKSKQVTIPKIMRKSCLV